jgi:transposase InsO family protein
VKRFLSVSERRACQVLRQCRSSFRYRAKENDEKKRLIERMRDLSQKHPRYGYRRIGALLRQEGWVANEKRVYRLWRLEGLKVPVKQRKKRRLGHSGAGSQRKRASHLNEVWCYDFVQDQTEDGRRLKILTVVDEYSRECLFLLVERRIKAVDLIKVLEQLIKHRGVPKHLRSDNGPEFIAKAVQGWLERAGTQTLYIEPGSVPGKMRITRASTGE